MNIHEIVKTDISQDDFLKKTKAYFVRNGFKLIKAEDNKLFFSRGSVVLNMVTFNPLKWKSKIEISFGKDNSVIIDADISTVGQLVMKRELKLWDDFINNYKKEILAKDSASKEKHQKKARDNSKNNLLSNIDSLFIGKMGIFALILSLFVNAVYFFQIAIVLGLFGIYLSFAQKSSKKSFWINGIVLFLGIFGIIMILLLAG